MSNTARAPPQRKNIGFRAVLSGGRPAPNRQPVAEKQEEEESEEEAAPVWPPVRKARTSDIDNQPPVGHVATTLPPTRRFAKEEEEESEHEPTLNPRNPPKARQDVPASVPAPRDPLMSQFVERLSNEYGVDPELTWRFLNQTQSLTETESLLKGARPDRPHVSAASMTRTISGREALEVEQALLEGGHVDDLQTTTKRRTNTPLKIRLGVREDDTDQVYLDHSRASEYIRLSKAGRVDEFWKREKRRRRSSGTPLGSQPPTPFTSPAKVSRLRVEDAVEGYVCAIKEKNVEDVMKLGTDMGRAAVLEQTMRLVDLNNALQKSL